MNNVFAKDEKIEFVVRGYNSYDAPTSVSFSDDSYRMILRGDTRDGGMNGIGVFEGNIASDVTSRLREKIKNVPLIEGIFMPIMLVDKDIKYFFSDGQRQCKLDAEINLAPSSDGRIIIIIHLINSGREKFVIENPINWDGESNKIMKSSNISILGKNNEKLQSEDIGFYFDNVGGTQLIKSTENVNEGDLMLEPGQTRVIEFFAFPDKPIKKGSYSAAATISLKKIIEPIILKGVVEFSSLTSQIVFTRDYPSTPAEIKAFNAYLKSREVQ